MDVPDRGVEDEGGVRIPVDEDVEGVLVDAGLAGHPGRHSFPLGKESAGAAKRDDARVEVAQPAPAGSRSDEGRQRRCREGGRETAQRRIGPHVGARRDLRAVPFHLPEKGIHGAGRVADAQDVAVQPDDVFVRQRAHVSAEAGLELVGVKSRRNLGWALEQQMPGSQEIRLCRRDAEIQHAHVDAGALLVETLDGRARKPEVACVRTGHEAGPGGSGGGRHGGVGAESTNETPTTDRSARQV